MSLENKFHEKIEEQAKDKKEEKWRAMSSNLELIQNNETMNNSKNTKVLIRLPSKAIICFIALFILFLVVVTIISIYLKSNKNIKVRYCTSDEYAVSETDVSLKEYAESINKTLLFFDWYEETILLTEEMTKLNDTGEIICFAETMMDMNTGYMVTLRVTDGWTDIDALESIKDLCYNQSLEQGIKVEWGGGLSKSCAIFEYEDYKYYLEVSRTDDMELALEYVALLLSVGSE